MKHPCAKDCPRRSAECRSTCPEWAEYEAAKKADYAEREKRWQAEGYFCENSIKIKKRKYKKTGKWK